MIAFFQDGDERKRDAKRKRQNRANDRDIKIGKCANPRRRKRALCDVFSFLEMYFGHRFYNPLTEMHREIVREIMYRAQHGGDKAIAAPRGEGKTTIAECAIIYAVIKGLLRFPVIVAANAGHAKDILDNIKNEFESNELLAADFHEVCDPIIALEGGTARQNMQTVDGKRTYLKWMTDKIVFPTLPKKYGSRCCGTVLMTRGLDAAIRGLRHNGIRPDFVLIDDPETRESAASIQQIKTREDTIDRDIAGLGGQSKKIGRLALVTLQNKECLAARLTDRSLKPSWSGHRFKTISEWPTNPKLWDEYINLRRNKTDEDKNAAAATEFYLHNRNEMDAGAVMANPYRFVAELEYSALQSAYNFIADKKMPAFMAECQNDPLDDNELDASQISPALVRRRISGFGHQEVPPGTAKIVSFVDIGDTNFNWVDAAWREDCIGHVIDYNITAVRSGEFNRDSAKRDEKTLELALISALHDWRAQLINKYRDDRGNPVPVSIALVDSGSGTHTKAVYKFCREVGPPFFPSKGMHDFWRIPPDAIKRADRCALVKQDDGMRVYQFESTYWKKFCHDRFITETFDDNHQFRTGSLSLFVCPDVKLFFDNRNIYSHQICGEIWGSKKPGAKPVWIIKGHNHFLDATAGICLAANICGIRIVGEVKPPRKTLSLAEMAQAAQRR